MVRFSQAASVLLLALGTTAFVPSKLGNVGVRSSVSSPAVDFIESCDAVLSRTNGKSVLIMNSAQTQDIDLEKASSYQTVR